MLGRSSIIALTLLAQQNFGRTSALGRPSSPHHRFSALIYEPNSPKTWPLGKGIPTPSPYRLAEGAKVPNLSSLAAAETVLVGVLISSAAPAKLPEIERVMEAVDCHTGLVANSDVTNERLSMKSSQRKANTQTPQSHGKTKPVMKKKVHGDDVSLVSGYMLGKFQGYVAHIALVIYPNEGKPCNNPSSRAPISPLDILSS